MSMDLFVWKAPVTDDPDEAAKLVGRYYDEDDRSVVEPSADIAAFAEALRSCYSDEPTDFGDDDCPWASLPFDQTDRLIALNIRWSADNSVLDAIVELAREHRLVVSVEDNGRVGGCGAVLLQALTDAGVTTPVQVHGIPQEFLGHAKRAAILERIGLTPQALARGIIEHVAATSAADDAGSATGRPTIDVDHPR